MLDNINPTIFGFFLADTVFVLFVPWDEEDIEAFSVSSLGHTS
jgi:hypothetical protein